MSIVHREIGENIYQLSSDMFSLSTEPGSASRNAYLVKGEKRAILLDLSLEEPGLFEYAESLAGVPVQLVLSHGHVDHTYHLNERKFVWLHPGDTKLLLHGTVFQRRVRPCPQMNYLFDGDIIDLGDRVLKVIHIPGHTDGSILLWDERTGILLSGDTVARRLLYGLHGFVPFTDFCSYLSELKNLPICQIYSAHDRCALPPEHIDFMIESLSPDSLAAAKQTRIPFIGRYLKLTKGEESNLRYFDLAALVRT